MIPIELKNSSTVEMFKDKISGSLTAVTVNFVKIICIELDMLTWLITDPFVASLLILVIADLKDPFTYKLEGSAASPNVLGFLSVPLKVLTNLSIHFIVFI